MENGLTSQVVDWQERIKRTQDEANWVRLINEIKNKNVIPVIGPDFLVEGKKSIHTQIIEQITLESGLNSNPQTFSDLYYTDKINIYEAIYVTLGIAPISSLKPHKSLRLLIESDMFPFIITTSFTPIVENTMKEVYGEDNVNVKQFRNNPSEDKDNEDFYDWNILKKQHTVYYMFGKYSYESHRYAVTDLDMMNFCTAWLSKGRRPEKLAEIIKGKYLLILGNNYSDWQFRFIWYSMRSIPEESKPLSHSLVVSSHPKDSPLIKFLERLNTITKNNPTEVIDEIIKRLEESGIRNSSNIRDEAKFDVFISYSRSDENIAARLYQKLVDKGLTVWFDRPDLDAGDRWRNKIETGIRNSRIFIPILSLNIEKEIHEEHEYRNEWRLADDKVNRMGAVPFIVPLAERDFDFYNPMTDIPKTFKELHAIHFDRNSDFELIADTILNKVNEIKSHKY